jgi:hypothetical protein
MAKSFFGSGFAVASDARRRSGSVSTAIAVSAIAVRRVVTGRGSSNGVAPTAVINGVRKAGWIIAIGNARIGAGGRELA